MVLNNIKSMRKDHGFTIVELLVVIVVIGILAAITIVSYTGVASRANAAKAVSNAQAVQSIAESINVDNSKYPVTTGEFATLSSVARIPAGLTIGVTNPTSTNGTTTFRLYALTGALATGGKIIFYDYAKANLCDVVTGNANSSTVDSCLFWGATGATILTSSFTAFTS